MCERAAPAGCADSRFAAWQLPPDVGPSNYKDNGDGTITDSVTGLMWQQDTAPSTMTWDDANLYCPTVTTGNHKDWRLPTRPELLTLVDYGKAYPGPAINSLFNTQSGRYGTSTLRVASSSVWYVDFSYGISPSTSKAVMVYVRCVR